ncbi:MAG: tRNA (guanosine(46)-N7)-methyltransferase TrmB [Candidatus Sumerlaeia bacterium]|nr:tRNA (guanosine(46)-N7)-methyltransferase TrmB [Candidatus Sumerlaeia bacterium]
MESIEAMLALDESQAPLSWPAVFGNFGPVEIEIGMGKGTLLRHLAAAAPERNFIGIERANKYLRLAAQRIARDRQSNIRVVRADAVYFLETFVPDASIAVFHIYFSDPWPKRRHAKRRLFQPRFVQLLERKTAAGGLLHIRTDVDWYFADIVRLFETETALAIREKGILDAAALPREMQTNFEIKYRATGKTIYALTLQKSACGGSGPG